MGPNLPPSTTSEVSSSRVRIDPDLCEVKPLKTPTHISIHLPNTTADSGLLLYLVDFLSRAISNMPSVSFRVDWISIQAECPTGLNIHQRFV